MRYLVLFLIAVSAFSAPLIEEAHVTDITYGSGHILVKSRTYTSITVTSGTDTFTIGTGHAFANGDRVRFWATTMPGGVASGADEGTSYYVRNVSGNDFQISTTAAGAIVNVTSAGSSVNVYFDIDTLRVAYDVDPARLTSGPIASSNTRGDGGRYNWFDQTVNRLPAGTKVYVRLYAADSTGTNNTTWGCSAGTVTEGSLTGLACELGSDWPYFTTDADPGPINVSYPDGKYPKVATGGTLVYPTFGVLVEGDNLFTVADDCSDLESQKALAVAANASKHVKFVIPHEPTGVCDPDVFPAKSGTFKMEVTTGADDKLLAPRGTRVQETHRAALGKFNGGQLEVAAGGNGYIFSNLLIQLAEVVADTDVTPIAIASIQRGTSATILRITTSTNHGLSVGSIFNAHDIPVIPGATNVCLGGGPLEVITVHSVTSVSVSCGTGAVVPVGPDATAGRSIVVGRSQQITSITPSSASCSGGDALVTLGASAVHAGFTNLVVAVVEKTEGGSGLTGINGPWRMTPVSANSFCLQGSSAVTGTYVANSATFATDGSIRTIAKFNETSDDNWIDRCIIEGREFPERVYTGLTLFSNNSGITNSRIQKIASWMGIDPSTGLYKTYNTSTLNTTPIAVDFTFGQHNTISNNYVQGHGILLFAQQGNGTASDNHVEDVVISHNHVVMDFKYMAGHADNWTRLYYASRQAEELKRGMTILIEHNKFEQNWVDWVQGAWNLTNTIRGNPATVKPACTTQGNVIQDVIVRNNYMINTAGGIYFTNYDDSNCLSKDTKRIAIDNNVVSALDWYPRVAVPSVVYGAAGYGVTPFATSGTVTDLSAAVGIFVTNNTFHNPLGGGPRNMSMGRVTDVMVLDNLFTHTETSAGGFYTATGSNGLPTVTNSTIVTSSRWINLYGEIGLSGWQDPPVSRFRGNAVIRGTENNLQYATIDNACFALTTNDCNVSAAEMTSAYGSSSATYDSPAVNTTWAGTSPNARFAEAGWIAFPNRATGDTTEDYRFKFTTTPSQLHSSGGVSYMRKEIGVNWNKWWKTALTAYNARVHVTGSTTATVAYSSRGACVLQYSSSGFGNGTVVAGSTDASTLPKTIDLTGLSANTFYDYWLNCPSEEFTGRFLTNP